MSREPFAGKAMALRLSLGRLCKDRGVARTPVVLPLLPSVDLPQILCGLASTTAVDLDRCKFRPFAIVNVGKFIEQPPLLLKHDVDRVVGRIEDLDYDDRGNLRISARVDDPVARRCPAFSVAAKVIEYEIIDGGRDDFYALIRKAEITEVSLTEAPANPAALVTTRITARPEQSIGDLLIRKIGVLQKIVGLMRETSGRAKEPAPTWAERGPPPAFLTRSTQRRQETRA